MRRRVGAALFAIVVVSSCSDGDGAPDTTVPTTSIPVVDPAPVTEPVATTEPLIDAIDGPVSIDTAVRTTTSP